MPNKRSALKTFLEQMDVPESRMDTFRQENIRWLARNLGIRNKKHPMFLTAMELIKWILKNEN